MFGLILTLVLLGVLLWLIETYVPMSPVFKIAIRIVVVVCVVLYLLRVFGVADVPVPRVR